MKRYKKDRKINKKRLLFLLLGIILISIFSIFIYKRISEVRAADREWNQTDWRGDENPRVITDDVTSFAEQEKIDYLTDEYLTLEQKGDWQLSGWIYRKRISFDNSHDNIGVEPEVLSDFPVLIKLEDGVNIDYSKTEDDGSDIRFIDPDGTELSYEIENWDETEESYVWVKVPQIDSGNQDYIYIYYGNPTAVDAQDPSSVWSSGYKAVYHNRDTEPGIIADSTGANDATKGAVDQPFEEQGLIGKSQSYDGSNDYSITNNNFLNNPNSITIASWFRKTSGGHTYECVLHKASATTIGSSDYWMGVDIDDQLTATIGANTGVRWTAGQTNVVATYGEWYYLVATWDGSTVRVYINGEFIKQYALNTYQDLDTDTRMGSSANGTNYMFKGDIDELTVSDAFRSAAWIASEYKVGKDEFVNYDIEEVKYADSGYLRSNIFYAGYPADWGELAYQYAGQGTVEVKIRTSLNENMDGALDWSECDPISNNTTISSNNCIQDEHQYIQYEITLESGGSLVPVFNEITITFSASDQEPPEINASDVKFQGPLESNDWFKSPPTIYWDEGYDDPQGNGIEGYCIALNETESDGASSILDPATTSGILMGLNDEVENVACPYIITNTELDLSAIDGLTLHSDKRYYFSIKAVDYSGNIWEEAGVGDFQDVIQFRYDSNPPNNVMYISTPSINFGNIGEIFFTWPITGSAQASDSESTLLGWQYAINSSDSESWKGLVHHEKLGIEYIPTGGTEGIHYLSLLEDEVDIGNNTIYFRAVDYAGNTSTYSTGGISYSGQAPSFPAESVISITPQNSISNKFALNWPEATPGQEREILSYYYMINTQPPTNINTLKNNSSVYIPLEGTSVDSGMLVGAVKGSNTVYVVAVDDQDNYSPSNMISGTFELDSENPDPPLNLSVSDTSVKSSELWRVALTWEEPEYKGNGDVSYVIEKSLDGEGWFELDRIKGLAYSDVSLTSRNYHYRVGSIDSSDESRNNPSYAITKSILPEGRFELAPELIDEVQVSNVTSRGAHINWVTNRVSDSKVQIGVKSNNYFDDEMYRSEEVVNHEISLTNLQPGTTYYYRAKWTDEDGNTGTSSELTLVTNPAPRVEDVNISSVGLNYAILDITTKGAIKANILYGQTKNYGASKEINTSTVESEYSVMLTELEDGTQYHYTILLTDEEGYEYENFGDMVFNTPPRPQVSNIQIQEKKGVPTPTIEVFWESNIAVNSIVKYSNEGKSLDKVDMELIEGEHSMEIEGLDPDSSYQLTVEGVDGMGNRAISDVYAFTTATDTRPPEISGIKSEGDIQSSDIQSDRSRSAQLIVSWETDEPSTSQVLYGEGAGSDGYPYSTQTDAEMRYKHVIIVSNLTPSKVYHFKVVSKDAAGNVGESGSVTSITPKSTDTVMESVLGSLGRIFNFL